MNKNMFGGAQALAILKKIEDQQNEMELLKNKNVQLQNEIDEKKIYRYGIPDSPGKSFTIKTNLKCNYAWTAYGALCLLVARDNYGSYLEAVDNLLYVSFESVGNWTRNNISQKVSQDKIRVAYSIDEEGFLNVTLTTVMADDAFFTNFSMCLIPF